MEPYAPFYHGVASGDPLTDRVILWTKATPDDTTQPLSVNWRIALDTSFSQIINSGTVTTDQSRDYTVKVDATGLQPDTWYYYDFAADSNHSLIGRTKTAPVGDIDQVRFAVATCAKFSRGFFNSYARIGERNDIDAVIHLGDYIYENDQQGDIGRPMIPPKRLQTLDEYRTRYAQYRSDPDLIYAHQQYPWIVVWDDHETSNNAWQYGSEHWPDSTVYAEIKRVATQAYFEWMPIRRPDTTEPYRIYREFQYGDLVDLLMLDTRREGRMQQVPIGDPATYDSNRTILGAQQYDWLIENLDSSTAQWKVIGQQVMFAPLRILGSALNEDQWDGYPAERAKILNHLHDQNQHNTVILSGDFHVAWASDLPYDDSAYDTSGQGSVAVEFVVPAIAQDSPDLVVPFSLIKANNPHIQYVEFELKGYTVLDITKDKAQGDFYYVPTILYPTPDELFGAALYNLDSTDHLEQSNTPTIALSAYPAQAPLAKGYDPTTSITAAGVAGNKFILYPNPVTENLYLKLVQAGNPFTLEIYDLSGKLLKRETFSGNTQHSVAIGGWAPGTYLAKIVTHDNSFTRKFIITE